MNQLLEKHPSHLYAQTQNRRHTFERRQSLPSFAEVYHWYSGIAIKLGGLILIAMLAAWWQKPAIHKNDGGLLGPAAAYHWAGYHRVGVETSEMSRLGLKVSAVGETPA